MTNYSFKHIYLAAYPNDVCDIPLAVYCHVTRHLKHGHAHITADTERDTEPHTAEQCHVKAGRAGATRTPAALDGLRA